jgi:hypothetical protein
VADVPIDTSDLEDFLNEYLEDQGYFFSVERPAQRPLEDDAMWRRALNRGWISWLRTDYEAGEGTIEVFYKFTRFGIGAMGLAIVDADGKQLHDDDFALIYDGAS